MSLVGGDCSLSYVVNFEPKIVNSLLHFTSHYYILNVLKMHMNLRFILIEYLFSKLG